MWFERLQRATAAALETMFFTSIESVMLPRETENAVITTLHFDGPLHGEFHLLMDRAAAESLASTLLCIDAGQLTTEQPTQVAGELANMICGSLLSRLEPDADMVLGAPRVLQTAEALHDGCWLRLPEGMLAVNIRFDTEVLA